MGRLDLSKMVFVFGSNEAGAHGTGAAKYAREQRRMPFGKSYGHYGECFAIPTKDDILQTLPLSKIEYYVHGFLAYAHGHPKTRFQVTQLGCGLAGYKPKDIAPMFIGASENCYFDNVWFPYLTVGAGDNPQHKFWGTVP